MYCLKLFLHGAEVKELSLESGREYTFGRGNNCDVQLEEQPGLSRVHFRLIEEDSQWTMHVVSKFGHVMSSGQPVQTLVLEPGTVFKFAGYDFRFLLAQAEHKEDERHDEGPDSDNENLPMVAGSDLGQSTSNLPARISNVPFDGNDEATKVITKQVGVPHLRIVHASGREDTIKLDAPKWIAGREDGSQIQLDDKKASRRQFELSISAQGAFIRDLGSSNGTMLNGMPLAADELKAIRSGDVIQVGSLTLHYEVRDPLFEKRLMVVPPSVLSAPPVVMQPTFEMINYPVASGPGGAVDPVQEAKKKKIKFYFVAAAVIGGLVALLSLSDSGPKKKAPKPVAAQSTAYDRLGPQAQQKVKETYILARNLLMQQKRELAMDQLTELHKILPEGYENSRAMEDEIRAQVDQERAAAEAKREYEAAAEAKKVVEKNLRDCEQMANTTMDESALRGCLAPSFERDPTNPLIANYMERVKLRLAQRAQKSASAKNYSGLVGKGRALFEKAEATERRGDVFGAIEAYKKHLAANYPDPDHLREKSQQSIKNIQGGLASQTSQFVKAAEDAYAKQDYKNAIANIKKVKNIDPSNQRAAELNANIRRELTTKLRDLYEDAIINEGLGKIDEAKADWKKILELDHPDGDYYKKARSKMKAFGGV